MILVQLKPRLLCWISMELSLNDEREESENLRELKGTCMMYEVPVPRSRNAFLKHSCTTCNVLYSHLT